MLFGRSASPVGHGADDDVVEVGLGCTTECGGRSFLHDSQVFSSSQKVSKANVGNGFEILPLLLVRFLHAFRFIFQFFRPLEK